MVWSRLKQNLLSIRSNGFQIQKGWTKWVKCHLLIAQSNVMCEYSYNLPLISLAHGCCVIKPWAACSGVSSAPLNKKITLWRNRFSCCANTLNTSNITQQLAASSLAPGLKTTTTSIHVHWMCDNKIFKDKLNLPSCYRIKVAIQHQCMIFAHRIFRFITASQSNNEILYITIDVCHWMWFEIDVVRAWDRLNIRIDFLIWMCSSFNEGEFTFEKIYW